MTANARSETRYAAFLRGVNVGGKNKLPMAELRALVESFGCTEVATYIQSGNILFCSDHPLLPYDFENAIAEYLGITTLVILRTASELNQIVTHNPYSAKDSTTVHVGFLGQAPLLSQTNLLDGAPFAPDHFVIIGSEIYLHLPNGMARAKLPGYLDRRLKLPLTIRSWRTVTKVAELSGITNV